MRLRGWVLLLVGCFTLTSFAGASVKVENIGYDASLGILLEENIAAFRTLESRSGGMDLNGDDDTADGVLQILDTATGAVFNTGFDASGGLDLNGGVVAFRVIERRQGDDDLNDDGDTSDIVQFTYDVASGAVTNLGLASLSFHVSDGLVAFAVSETNQGDGDLNGDGDVEDLVLYVTNPATGLLANLALAGGEGFLAGAEGVVFVVSESSQGGSVLNDDGDISDNVLHFYDAATGTTRNLGFAVGSGAFAVEDGLVAFLVNEAAQDNVDLNSDGDAFDDVLHVYDVASQVTRNTGFASSSFLAAEGLVAFTVDEAANGGDENGDGDASDHVLHLVDGAGMVSNLGFAVDGFALDGSYLAFAVDEDAQANTDFNGDGDRDDVVLHLQALGSASAMNLATDASLGFKLDDDTLLAFGAHESAQGVDLNGDGDFEDFVLHVFDIAAGSLLNLAVDPSGGFQTFQLDSTYVSIGVKESAQGMDGTDLNADGDTADIVLHLFDSTTRTMENIGLDVGSGHAVDDGRIVFGVSEARQGGYDLNGDGDTGDVIVHVATVEPSVFETPEEMIEALMTELASLNLPSGTEHSRMVSLEAALASLAAGDVCGALGSLQDFINKVEAQSGKKIPAADAAALIAGAEEVIEMLDQGTCGV